MPNDAKLGMVVGVGLVILIAVVFFGKDLVPERAAAPASTASLVVGAARSAEEPANDELPKAQTTSYSRPILGEVISPVFGATLKKS